MEKRKLGNIEVSPIGMGCMAFSHGYGEVPTEQYGIEAIRRAYDYGCTFFDTAEGYGGQQFWPGHNEQLLGKAVAPMREKVVLATKFMFMGTICKEGPEMVAFIRRHIEQSLKNLRTDYIDLYYLHRVNRQIPVESVARAMEVFIKEGLIRGWGLSQVGADTIRRAHEVTPLSAVQNIYSMVERGIEQEVIPCCMERGIGVVPFSPIASGFLSGKVTAQTDFSHSDDVRKFVPQLRKENIEANQPILDLLAEYAAKKQATKAQISLAWMLRKYPNVVPIPGSRNQERILENLGGWNVTLTDDEFQRLDNTLNRLPVHGYRGFEEYEGGTMADWGKKP